MDSLHIVLTKSIITAIEVTRLVLLEASKIFPDLQGRLIQMGIEADAQGTFKNNPARRILLRMILYPSIKVSTNCNLIMQNGEEWDLAIVDLILSEPHREGMSFRCKIIKDKVQIELLR